MELTKPPKILVIRLNAIGDVAMAVPVLWSFVKTHQNAEITFVSQGFAKDFIKYIPNLTFYEANLRGHHKGFLGLLRLYFDLKKLGKWDIVIDIHDVVRTKILRFLFSLTGKKIITIDKGRKEKEELTRISNKIFKQLDTTVSRYYKAFNDAGFEFNLQFDYLFTKATLDESILKHTGPKEHRWIGVAPFAKHKGKIYPLNLLEEVIKKLSSSSSIKLFFFGGGGEEQKILENLANKFPNSVSLARKLSIEDELKVISNLDVMLAMDSANMHLASLVNTPVISIWGATHPYAGFYGWNQNTTHAVQIDFPCRPCSIYGNKPCFRKDYACLHNISPDSIISKIHTEIIR